MDPTSVPNREPSGQPTDSDDVIFNDDIPVEPKPTPEPTRASKFAPTPEPTRSNGTITDDDTLAPEPTTTPTSTSLSPPTPYPTLASRTTVKFNVTQKLDGVSSDDFNSQYFLNALVFQETVVKVTHLEDINEINILSVHSPYAVTTYSNSNSRLIFADGNNTESVDVVYETSVVVGEGNSYTNPNDAYDETSALLESSISSGEFTSILDAYAEEEGSSVLLHASANTPASIGDPIFTTIDTTSGDNDSSHGIFTLANVIISVVCIAFAMSFFAMYYWNYRYRLGKGTWRTRPSVDRSVGSAKTNVFINSTLEENLI